MESGTDATPVGQTKIGPIKLFAIKVAIVVFAIFIVVSYVDIIMQQYIADIKHPHIGGHEFWTKLERELDNQADPKSDLSPEKKQKILADIKAISDRWRPFLEEAWRNAAGASSDVTKH
jgi:hypothetical protein